MPADLIPRVTIRWTTGTVPPFGCRWCGDDHRHHGQSYVRSQGLHAWEQPTAAQILARMLARRAVAKDKCRCVEPHYQMPMAPVVDPWRCEADSCRMHDRLLGMWMTPLSFDQAVAVGGTDAR